MQTDPPFSRRKPSVLTCPECPILPCPPHTPPVPPIFPGTRSFPLLSSALLPSLPPYIPRWNGVLPTPSQSLSHPHLLQEAPSNLMVTHIVPSVPLPESLGLVDSIHLLSPHRGLSALTGPSSQAHPQPCTPIPCPAFRTLSRQHWV